MTYVNQKIMRILKKEFGINKNDIVTNTDLISEYNLCGWELELLYAKIEQAFKIEIDMPIPQDELSVTKLVNDVLIGGLHISRKQQVC